MMQRPRPARTTAWYLLRESLDGMGPRDVEFFRKIEELAEAAGVQSAGATGADGPAAWNGE